MNHEKRRRRSAEARRCRRVKKQELELRIQKLRGAFFERLKLALVMRMISCRNVEQAPKRKDGTRSCERLSLEERQQIYALRALGVEGREIARRVNRDASTISRELKRNQPLRLIYGQDPYSRAKQAHDLACTRRRQSRQGRVRLKSLQTQRVVYQAIKDGYTPELISARLLLEQGVRLSHEAIYRWIYDVERSLIEYLPRKGKRYRRGGQKRTRALRQPSAPKTSIEKRPRAANERSEFGHWEVDTVVSKQSSTCLLVLQERTSRFFFVVRLPHCTVEEASQAVIKLLSPLDQGWVKSLTCDNGPENWGHEAISRSLGIPVYFCHPYCSSERGGVENRNGVLRRFFPKKTNFNLVSDEVLNRVWRHLINRPMRCLGYFTPQEILNGKFEPLFQLAA